MPREAGTGQDLGRVSILELRRNLGHQRAIAIGRGNTRVWNELFNGPL